MHFIGPPALAADGGVGLTDADDPLVGEDDQGRQADEHQAHGEAHALGAAVDEGLHLGGQGEVADPGAQVGRHAVGTDGLAEGHDHGGEDAGQHQGQGNGFQNLHLIGAADLAHLLQLRVDGAQGGGDVYVGEGVVVQAHTKDDGHGAVGQPVGNGDAHAGQEAQGARGLVAEHRQPGQGLAPGGDHVGDDHQHAQQLLAGDVGADHQPAQHGAQRHRHDDREEAHHQGVLQRAPQGGAGQLAYQDIPPIVQRKVAHLAAVPLGLGAGQGEGGGDHLQQGDHDQAEQDD